MLFLIMQFLWKYVDDIMGKGVEMTIILKLLFYTSANIIPLALPIAILFSSIMTMGNLAESSELTSMKASGMSLFKVMKPMFIFIIFISIGAFYFSNYILPIANLKQRTLIYDLQSKKPAFSLQEGVFYNDIEGYSIKVDEKISETGELFGVLIYQNGKTNRIIKAKQGELVGSENDQFLLLKLIDGVIYEEANLGFNPTAKKPFRKSFFKESMVKFDMRSFKLQKSDEDLFKREYEMMNFAQLGQAVDSFKVKIDSFDLAFKSNFLKETRIFDENSLIPVDTTLNKYSEELVKIDTIIYLDSIPNSQYRTALQITQSKLRAKKDYIMMNIQMGEVRFQSLNEYKTEWHKKFTLSFAIIVLFFVGAPLGAIIKKGGLGAPLIFATLFFLLYYILSITGENMIESQMVSPFWGMWASSLILVPLGLFLTYKAANDSALFDRDVYKRFFIKYFKKKNKR
jgi:lipopolysaccharide export system permease protein